MTRDLQVALILGGLSLWCAVYAAVLNRLHDAYSPDYVWLTVVIGACWILIAMAIFAYFDHITWYAWRLLIGATSAAGAPVIVWQLLQNARRRALRDPIKNGGGDAAVHTRRP